MGVKCKNCLSYTGRMSNKHTVINITHTPRSPILIKLIFIAFNLLQLFLLLSF